MAAWYKNRDDIVRFNAQGQVVRTIRAAISSVTEESELDTHVAVDGLGNIYALGTFSNAVSSLTRTESTSRALAATAISRDNFARPQRLRSTGKGESLSATSKACRCLMETAVT